MINYPKIIIKQHVYVNIYSSYDIEAYYWNDKSIFLGPLRRAKKDF